MLVLIKIIYCRDGQWNGSKAMFSG